MQMFKHKKSSVKILGLVMLATIMLMVVSSCSMGPRCASGKAMKHKGVFLKH